MMHTTLVSLGLLALAAALSACGERPQDLSGAARQDAPAYAGVGNSPFQQPGWKAGDQTSWTQALKARAQYGMNDHGRITTP